MNPRTLLAALAVSSFLACGAPGGQADGGPPPPPPDSTTGLFINAGLGVELVQSPITNGKPPEGPVKGTVLVTQKDANGPLVPAKLTANGVEVPQENVLGVFLGYDFTKADLTSVKPGDPITFHAELDGGTATLTVHCPPEVTITAPAEGSQGSVGDMVTVQWSGSVDHSTPFKPDIMVYGFDPATGAHVHTDFKDRVVSGKTQDTIELPDPKMQPQWSVELYATGDFVQSSAGAGWCGLLRRVHLIKK